MADTPEPNSTTPTTAAEQPPFVELFPGTALSAAEADAVTLRSRTHLIILAGAEDSGKTTALASIYERLCQGPFADFHFAGSRSLPGFEDICHLNRLESGGVRPETQRTVPTEDAKYYHLALKRWGTGAARRHVLLSAMSGELFRMAKDSREDAERLTYLRRADTIAVLVDGARLAVPAQRTNAQADAAGILDSFLDANMVGANCKVEVVFSKADRVHAAGEVAIDFLGKTKEKLEARFRSRLRSLSFRMIAARPDPSSSSDAWDAGLAAAFLAWMTPYRPAGRDDWKMAAPPVGEREFSKFGWRHFERMRSES